MARFLHFWRASLVPNERKRLRTFSGNASAVLGLGIAPYLPEREGLRAFSKRDFVPKGTFDAALIPYSRAPFKPIWHLFPWAFALSKPIFLLLGRTANVTDGSLYFIGYSYLITTLIGVSAFTFSATTVQRFQKERGTLPQEVFRTWQLMNRFLLADIMCSLPWTVSCFLSINGISNEVVYNVGVIMKNAQGLGCFFVYSMNARTLTSMCACCRSQTSEEIFSPNLMESLIDGSGSSLELSRSESDRKRRHRKKSVNTLSKHATLLPTIKNQCRILPSQIRQTRTSSGSDNFEGVFEDRKVLVKFVTNNIKKANPNQDQINSVTVVDTDIPIKIRLTPKMDEIEVEERMLLILHLARGPNLVHFWGKEREGWRS
jgi:hypothetical protein